MASDFWKSSQFKHFMNDIRFYDDDDDNDFMGGTSAPSSSAAAASQQQQQATASASASASAAAAALDFGITFTPHEKKLLIVYYIQQLRKLGERLSLDARVLGTASIYMRRFYLRNAVTDCDPMLLVPATVLLASKIEESQVNVIKNIQKNLLNVFKAFEQYYTVQDILECECFLMDELDFYLSVFHPYKPLKRYTLDCRLQHQAFLQTAWNIINDSYYSDVCLQYPPYLIALASIYMTSILERDNSTIEVKMSGSASAAAAASAFSPLTGGVPPMTPQTVSPAPTSVSTPAPTPFVGAIVTDLAPGSAGVPVGAAAQAPAFNLESWVRQWFGTLNVNMSQIGHITNSLLEMYKTTATLAVDVQPALAKLEEWRRRIQQHAAGPAASLLQQQQQLQSSASAAANVAAVAAMGGLLPLPPSQSGGHHQHHHMSQRQ